MILYDFDLTFGLLKLENFSYSPALEHRLELAQALWTKLNSDWQVELPCKVAPEPFLDLNSAVINIVVQQS